MVKTRLSIISIIVIRVVVIVILITVNILITRIVVVGVVVRRLLRGITQRADSSLYISG